MASFTTRVELHDATWKDYETLHERMRAGGFWTTITSDTGKIYHLPPAEYRSDSQGTARDVCNKAYGIASTVKANPAVFVTKGDDCAWNGLKEAGSHARAS